jgi:hypothetical protein
MDIVAVDQGPNPGPAAASAAGTAHLLVPEHSVIASEAKQSSFCGDLFWIAASPGFAGLLAMTVGSRAIAP